MIIGSGLLAKSFAPYFSQNQDIIVFASGVSNSHEDKREAFLREEKMLRDTIILKKNILYFSTCSIDDPDLLDTSYVVHKKRMELIVNSIEGNYIFRLPQVVGKTNNSHTLTNYLNHMMVTDSSFQIWQYAKRNLIDADDVAIIANYLVHNVRTSVAPINIASPFTISIPKLVQIFEIVLGVKAKYTLVEAGGSYEIESNLAQEAANALGVSFDSGYIERIIRKYYEK